MRYRHYSFDLWFTLIKSNPHFKDARAAYFYTRYNNAGKTKEEIAAAFRTVDSICNSVNEKTGKNIDADEMYLMALHLMNDGKLAFDHIDCEELYNDMDKLVMDYTPVLYCSRTKEVLERLKEKDITVSLLSNTGFIKGSTLRIILQLLDVDRFLDFQLYSDEAGMSKPNSSFFNLMLGHINTHNPAADATSIIHIGDNPVADIGGAAKVGINNLLINSNNKCIISIFD